MNRTVWPLGLSEATTDRILQEGSLLREDASSPLPCQASRDPPAADSHRRLPFLSLSRKVGLPASSHGHATNPKQVKTKLLEQKIELMGNLLQEVQASLEKQKEQCAHLSEQLATIDQKSNDQEEWMMGVCTEVARNQRGSENFSEQIKALEEDVKQLQDNFGSKMKADTRNQDAFIEAQTQEKQELLRFIDAQTPEERMMVADPQKCPKCKLEQPHTDWVQCICDQWWHTICLPSTRGKSMQQIKDMTIRECPECLNQKLQYERAHIFYTSMEIERGQISS